MYFVHPQIRKKILPKVFLSFFKKPQLEEIKKKLSFYFPGKAIYFVDMGRTAFRLILEKLNLKHTQILLPAFICDIFFPILKEKEIEPIFLDINLRTFQPEFDALREKITPKTKAILWVETFGLAGEIEKVCDFAHKNNIFLIEDCAHSFFGKKEEKFLGNFGIVSFFSLYKQMPMARGGLLVCPKDWKIKLKESKFTARDFLSLLNSIPFFATLFKKFGKEIAPKIQRKEKGKDFFALNSISLRLFSLFFESFESEIEKRKKIALFFQEKLQELGFEVQESKDNVFTFLSALLPQNFSQNRDKIVKELQKRGVFCTRIWHTPLILNKEAQSFWKIKPENYPNTIEAAKRIINFPLQSYYQKKDIEKMVTILKKVIFC